jgi:hypothetical protein
MSDELPLNSSFSIVGSDKSFPGSAVSANEESVTALDFAMLRTWKDGAGCAIKVGAGTGAGGAETPILVDCAVRAPEISVSVTASAAVSAFSPDPKFPDVWTLRAFRRSSGDEFPCLDARP